MFQVQEAEKNGAASGGEPAGKQAAGKSPKGKQSGTQPKQLDPGAYPGKESVGFFRESPPCKHSSAPHAQDTRHTLSDACVPVLHDHTCRAPHQGMECCLESHNLPHQVKA